MNATWIDLKQPDVDGLVNIYGWRGRPGGGWPHATIIVRVPPAMIRKLLRSQLIDDNHGLYGLTLPCQDPNTYAQAYTLQCGKDATRVLEKVVELTKERG